MVAYFEQLSFLKFTKGILFVLAILLDESHGLLSLVAKIMKPSVGPTTNLQGPLQFKLSLDPKVSTLSIPVNRQSFPLLAISLQWLPCLLNFCPFSLVLTRTAKSRFHSGKPVIYRIEELLSVASWLTFILLVSRTNV